MDHKRIGIRYIVTAFIFLIAGGIEALLMRLQLAHSDLKILSPEAYDQLFTMHGFTMIFFYAGPVLSGFSNYLWPLLLGSRDMAFPRLNALSYWIFLLAGIFLYASFPLGLAPNAGWFNYPPLCAGDYNPGPNIDFYLLGLIFLGISTTVGCSEFPGQSLRTRAPGMSINRLPILVWGTLTASVGNLLAVPAVSLACVLLFTDRQFGTHFFDVAEHGQPLLWQHLFWMFGHPWVYAIVLPALGIVSDALPTFCRRPLVGYTPVALATVATMIVGFGVWLHHMFATGMPVLSLAFFSAASLVITIPSAVSTFAWIATIWTGKPVLTTPFLFLSSFIILFVIGGVSGVMTGGGAVGLPTDRYLLRRRAPALDRPAQFITSAMGHIFQRRRTLCFHRRNRFLHRHLQWYRSWTSVCQLYTNTSVDKICPDGWFQSLTVAHKCFVALNTANDFNSSRDACKAGT